MAQNGIQIRCFNSFASARADAAGGLDAAAQPSPFDRIDWFEALHESAFAGQTPLILRAQQADARAWLFLTGADESGPLGGIANWYSFHFGPQFQSAPDRETRGALLGALAAELRRTHRRLRFHPIVDGTGIDAALIEAAFHAAGWHAIARVLAYKRLLDIAPGTHFTDYWAARPGPLRTTLQRKARRHPLDIAIHRRIAPAIWAALETVFAASWKPAGDDFAFLRRFAEREAAAGRLRLGLATREGTPVAVELWTVDRDCAYIHKLAFHEGHAEASPGTQLSHAMFRAAIDEDRVRRIDFGTGDNDYKDAWMPRATAMRQIDLFDLRKPQSWRPALTTWLSALSQPGLDARGTGGDKPDGRRAVLTRRA